MQSRPLAILSDIHGNSEALSQVFADMDAMGIDRAVSLGDNIGYGPWPNEVVRMLLARKIPSVMGNHESAVLKVSEQRWFNISARQAIVQTRRLLDEATLRSISAYPLSLSMENLRFVHGCPPADIRTYLFQKEESELPGLFQVFGEAICFVGHTHEIGGILWNGSEIVRKSPGKIPFTLEKGVRAIINCGSVGQPRDGDNRAKYVIYVPASRSLFLRKVTYDVERTAAAIRRVGLPEVYARRLG
ncbi:metallophosphoesterase family protein [Desulfobotulus sp.]|jgi:predicted phosphodiesterase|uniref:metallophosphoesterase family protein n=1 Tax=Desulfobotulus sp. TaxID=1940337 RepID=UPI002A371623|nr:metallophosphoesterase [Desulfobotulus sp.]MDY0161742.1 metallophosphoesterase family protein [Desulfobotulus sp.]